MKERRRTPNSFVTVFFYQYFVKGTVQLVFPKKQTSHSPGKQDIAGKCKKDHCFQPTESLLDKGFNLVLARENRVGIILYLRARV